MTIRDRILEFLSQHPEGVDDDELARALKLKARQQASCRRRPWNHCIEDIHCNSLPLMA
jgi:hypothetical protein